MRIKHVLTFLLIVVMAVGVIAPAALPTATAQDGCGDAPSPRLTVGGGATVLFTDGSPLNVRDQAGIGGTVVAQMPEGTNFQVTDGPLCADNIYWWNVTSGANSGWIAEGAAGEYFVGPLDGAAVTPGDGLSVVPFTMPATQFMPPDWTQFSDIQWNEGKNPFLITLPPAYAGDLPPLPIDLGAVRFLDDAGLNDAQRALLAQNGFVVVPAGLDQFGDAFDMGGNWDPIPEGWTYENEVDDYGHAYFVTTDAMLHALHYIFDNLLTDLELLRFAPLMSTEVLPAVVASARAQRAEVAGTALEQPARAAELYLAVGLELFQPGAGIAAASPDLAGDIETIVAMAGAGSGQLELPFLPGYVEDFSQYRPRGHYEGDPVLEQYFRGMMWLSRITFRAGDAYETQIALLLLRALRGSQDAVEGWNTLNDTLSFLVGPVDDLGPPEYSQLADSFYSPMMDVASLADPTLLAGFQAELKTLPGPRVNGLILPDDTEAGEVEDAGRGFRFLGQRFTLDAYAMQQLMWPYVGTPENKRLMPLGLDVPSAVGGSETAYQLAIQAGAGDFANYDAQTLMLASETGTMTDAEWLENVYGGWLWTLRPLWNRDAAAYPPMMNTEAWRRKDVQTGLASWTELKHDTVLYAKQPTGFGGGGPPLTSFGYVEPNPLVFARIAIVAALTYEGLVARELHAGPQMMGYDLPRGHGLLSPTLQPGSALDATLGELRQLAFRSATYAEIARKELAGEPLTEDDYWSIFGIEGYLYTLLYTLYQGEGQPDPVALVTDVASNPSIGAVLQEAVGGVDYIYVVIPAPDGGLQLVRGGVFSYYEWTGDINQRMTDSEWRALVAAGDLPERPAWVDAFYAQ